MSGPSESWSVAAALAIALATLTGCGAPAQPPQASTPLVEPSATPAAPAASAANAAQPPAVEPAAEAAPAPTWANHELRAFGGRFRAELALAGPPTLREQDAPGGAVGHSERANVLLPIGEPRAVDCHLRAARLSSVELAQSVAKLVATYEVETLQASVEQSGARLVLRYAQRVTDQTNRKTIGTMRVAMAVGEGETLLCTHLGGDDGVSFDRVTRGFFESATGLATALPEYLDILRMREAGASGAKDIEHRLRVRAPLPGGKTFETALALNAAIQSGKLLVTETTTVLELDASGEVQLGTITTIDSAANKVEVGVIRLGPNRYGAGISVAGREQMSPIATSSPLTTELSMAPAIRRALDRPGQGAPAKLTWSELGGLGRGREVSVIQSRTFDYDARSKQVRVQSGSDVLRACEVDARGVLGKCQVERVGEPASTAVRELLYATPPR